MAVRNMCLQPMNLNSCFKKEFKPKTEEAKSAVTNAVATLAQRLYKMSLPFQMIPIKLLKQSLLIDRKLSEQINLILHHEDFQKLEGEWRGLHHFSDQYRNRYFTENQSITYF